ncbi:hypothetical protein C8Q80DRAFT_575010 [Daedaleopsis nitida]|nr:hypothetical protein C8Q80DRAFT_575010 [Daedaleopsis nitida]
MDNKIGTIQTGTSLAPTLVSSPPTSNQEDAPAATRPTTLTSLAYMLSELASLPSSVDANAPNRMTAPTSIERSNDPLLRFCLPRHRHSRRPSLSSNSAATGATPSNDSAFVDACPANNTSTQHANVQFAAAEDENMQYEALPHAGIVAAGVLGEATTLAPTIWGCDDPAAQPLTDDFPLLSHPVQPGLPGNDDGASERSEGRGSTIQEDRQHLALTSAMTSQLPSTAAEQCLNRPSPDCIGEADLARSFPTTGEALSPEITLSFANNESSVSTLDPACQAELLISKVSENVHETPALGPGGSDEQPRASQTAQLDGPHCVGVESYDLALPQNETQIPAPLVDEEPPVLADTTGVAHVSDDHDQCAEPVRAGEEHPVLTDILDDVASVAYEPDLPSGLDMTNEGPPTPTEASDAVNIPVSCDDPSIDSASNLARYPENGDYAMGDDSIRFELEDLPPSSLPASQRSDTRSIAEYAMPPSQESVRALSTVDISMDDMNTGASMTRADAPVLTVIEQLEDSSTTSAATSGILDGPGRPEEIVTDALVPAFEMIPSSPPPSSSPNRVFSSPGRQVFDSPPSSSPPLPAPQIEDFTTVAPTIEDKQEDISAPNSVSLKRRLDVDLEDDLFGPSLESTADVETKRMKLQDPSHAPLPPNPKRPTQASQAKQRKKLAAPFRSPVIKGPLVQGGLHAVYASGRAALASPSRKTPARDVGQEDHGRVALEPTAGAANKDRTAKAAKQFKSPLHASNATYPIMSSSAPSSSSSTLFSSVRAAPTIQALQGKVQALKQAIKIKTSGKADQDDILEQLVNKWTIAGREVAWAVWDHVKDLDPGPSTVLDAGQKGGWFEGEGDGVAQREDEMDAAGEPPVVQHTLGVMLRRLGIDPATLGWDEEEGDFVDAC